MKNDIEKCVKEYCLYYHKIIDGVLDYSITDCEKKILLCCLIDTLSAGRYPEERKNHKKFVDLIDQYSGWVDKDRICLQQLKNILSSINKLTIEEKKLLDYCEVENKKPHYSFRGWIPSSEIDPIVDELKRNYDCQYNVKSKIDKCKYSYLLYRYRNFLIHSYIQMDSPVVYDDMNTSCYVCYLGLSNSHLNSHIMLSFPLKLIQNIVKNILNSIEEYYILDKINPYNKHKFNTNWNEFI